MQINHSEIKDLTSVITLTLQPADYEEAVTKQIRQIRQKADIPGFRKGMVPAGLIKKMYGKSVLADVLNNKIAEELNKYIELLGWSPFWTREYFRPGAYSELR